MALDHRNTWGDPKRVSIRRQTYGRPRLTDLAESSI